MAPPERLMVTHSYETREYWSWLLLLSSLGIWLLLLRLSLEFSMLCFDFFTSKVMLTNVLEKRLTSRFISGKKLVCSNLNFNNMIQFGKLDP